MKKSQGPAKIFSGGASKSGLQAKLSHHYGHGEAEREIMDTPLQEDMTSEGGPRKSGGPAIVGSNSGDKLTKEQRDLVNEVARERSEAAKKAKKYKNDRGGQRSLYA